MHSGIARSPLVQLSSSSFRGGEEKRNLVAKNGGERTPHGNALVIDYGSGPLSTEHGTFWTRGYLQLGLMQAADLLPAGAHHVLQATSPLTSALVIF
ncbi:hypothetical protein AAFF_G00048240 [Aldrovandia affinis]|uniref:Uncharacterized protein n=1 Tax=Aldrovandia affinis TaxID=143900 RepID=A0AAD7WEL6_9TELE|nr:hypothetical protein AAFF_G00048240 [Aldrovandia affinis]